MSKNRKVEIIEWDDAASLDEWTDIAEIEAVGHRIVSVGFVLEESETAVVLALNIDTVSEKTSCVMFIPKGMIRSRTEITPLKGSPRRRSR